MIFNYLSNAVLLVLLFFTVACERQELDQLFFDRYSENEIVEKELVRGANVDTLFQDIPQVFKPSGLSTVNATKVIRGVKKYEALPLIAKYYFDDKNQLLFTHYEWSQSVPGISYEQREFRMSKEVNQFGKYAQKLEQLAVQLQSEMGAPVENDGALKKNKTSLLDFFSHKIKFFKEGKTVELCLIWSPKSGARFFKVFTKTYWNE